MELAVTGRVKKSVFSADALQVQSLTLQFHDGTTDYPVDVSKPFNIVATSFDSSRTPYNKIVVDAKVYTYTGLFGSCYWLEIPTFGLL